MNYPICPRCHTALEQTYRHCPVCGYGDLSDPNKPNARPAAPDLPISDPDQLMLFCEAMKDRLRRLDLVVAEWDQLTRSEKFKNSYQDVADANESYQDLYQTLLTASVWLPYLNMDPITDLMRVTVFCYFEVFNQVAKRELSMSGVDPDLIIVNETLHPRIKKSVEMSIDLCKSTVEQLVQAGGHLNFTAYTNLERYTINGFGLGLQILDHHITALKKNGGILTEGSKKYVAIALTMLEKAASIKDTKNVPMEAMDLFQDLQNLGEYISGVVNDLFVTLDLMDGEMCIKLFDLWNPRAKADIRTLDEKNKVFYQFFQ